MGDPFKDLEKDLTSLMHIVAAGGDGRKEPAFERVAIDADVTEVTAVDGAAGDGDSAVDAALHGGAIHDPAAGIPHDASPAQPSGLPKRGPGAPLGNQNALKHGLYSRVLTPEQRESLYYAEDAKFLDKEIVILRMKLETLLADPNTDTDLFLRALGMLSRMVRINDNIQFGP